MRLQTATTLQDVMHQLLPVEEDKSKPPPAPSKMSSDKQDAMETPNTKPSTSLQKREQGSRGPTAPRPKDKRQQERRLHDGSRPQQVACSCFCCAVKYLVVHPGDSTATKSMSA